MYSRKKTSSSRTSQRAVLKSKTIGKTWLNKEEKKLQKKILIEGLRKKGTVPKGNIALESENEKKFKGATRIAQDKLQKKQSTTRRGKKGIICISCLPHGFCEKQLYNYFSQYGDVLRVRLVRSEKSGRPCGYAYIEFLHEVVARMAAENMNGYLTFGKIMKCRFIEHADNLAKSLFDVEPFTAKDCPKVFSRAKAIQQVNNIRSHKQNEKRARRVVSDMKKKLLLLQSRGINLDLSVDLGDIKLKKPKREEVIGFKGKKKKITAEYDNITEIPAESEITTKEIPAENENTTKEIPAESVITTKEIPAENENTKEIPVENENTTKEIPAENENTTKEIPAENENTTKLSTGNKRNRKIPTGSERATKKMRTGKKKNTKEIPAENENTTKEMPAESESTTKDLPTENESTTKIRTGNKRTTKKPTGNKRTTKKIPTGKKRTTK